MADLSASLAPHQWATILRNLEGARVDNAEVLDRLHLQLAGATIPHGCSWPGMQPANSWHRPGMPSGLCSCGMRWPHVYLEDEDGRYVLG